MSNKKENVALVKKVIGNYADSKSYIPFNDFILDFLPFSWNLFMPGMTSLNMMNASQFEKQKLACANELQAKFQIKMCNEDDKIKIEPNIFEVCKFGYNAYMFEIRVLNYIKNYTLYSSTEAKKPFAFVSTKRSSANMEPRIVYKFKDGCINAVKREVHLDYFK